MRSVQNRANHHELEATSSSGGAPARPHTQAYQSCAPSAIQQNDCPANRAKAPLQAGGPNTAFAQKVLGITIPRPLNFTELLC